MVRHVSTQRRLALLSSALTVIFKRFIAFIIIIILPPPRPYQSQVTQIIKTIKLPLIRNDYQKQKIQTQKKMMGIRKCLTQGVAGGARRIALYPGMSMMMVYRDLISLKQVPGVHMMQALILAPPAARRTNLDFPRVRLPDSREMARHLRARFMNQQGEGWIYSCKMGTTLAHLPNGRRVFLKPQLRHIQRAVRAFLKHRRWLRQARRVFARCMQNSCLTPDMVQLICRDYV
jgi:hypothetical protein